MKTAVATRMMKSEMKLCFASCGASVVYCSQCNNSVGCMCDAMLLYTCVLATRHIQPAIQFYWQTISACAITAGESSSTHSGVEGGIELRVASCSS